MSMPTFPPKGADLTREQALTMIVASIAMEESSLSRIIDAEGEKLRCIIEKMDPCACPEDLLEVNRSVTKLLDVVAQNQLLLRNKLALALDAGEPCCPKPCPNPCPKPCPPACPPERPCPPPERPPCPKPQKSAVQLTGPGGRFLWKNGCELPWELCWKQGRAIRWSAQDPAALELDPQRTYILNATFNVCDFLPTEASGRICLECSPEDALCQQPPLWFSLRCAVGEPATLQYTGQPPSGSGCAPVGRSAWSRRR